MCARPRNPEWDSGFRKTHQIRIAGKRRSGPDILCQSATGNDSGHEYNMTFGVCTYPNLTTAIVCFADTSNPSFPLTDKLYVSEYGDSGRRVQRLGCPEPGKVMAENSFRIGDLSCQDKLTNVRRLRAAKNTDAICGDPMLEFNF